MTHRLTQVAITYRCNKDCSYCYAKGIPVGRDEMSWKDFLVLLGWLGRNSIKRFNFTGGEPTTHPLFARFLRAALRRGFQPGIFTNCLFPVTLLEKVPDSVNFLVNYNPRGHYTAGEYQMLHANLAEMTRRSMKYDFMINITEQMSDAGHVLDALKTFRPRRILLDFVMPNAYKCNSFVEQAMFRERRPVIMKMAEQLRPTGIPFMISRPFPLCVYRDCGVSFRSRCQSGRGILTVNPDLTVFPCLAVFFPGPRIDRFQTKEQITAFFDPSLRKLNWERHLYPECHGCIYMKRKKCQGSCLCYKCTPSRVLERDRYVLHSQVDQAGRFEQQVRSIMPRLDRIFGRLVHKPRLFLYMNREELELNTCTRLEPWAIGLVLGSGYHQAGADIGDESLMHELCHIYVQYRGTAPSWFAEGLCEYIAYGSGVSKRYSRALQRKRPLPLKVLMNARRLIEIDSDIIAENIAYQESAMLVAKMVEKSGLSGVLGLIGRPAALKARALQADIFI